MSAGGGIVPRETAPPTTTLMRFTYIGGVWAAAVGVLGLLVITLFSTPILFPVYIIPVCLFALLVGMPFGFLAGIGALLGARAHQRVRPFTVALGGALVTGIGLFALLAGTGLLQQWAIAGSFVIVAAGILSPLTTRWIGRHVAPRDPPGAWLIVAGIAVASASLGASALLLSLTSSSAATQACDRGRSTSWLPPQVTCALGDGGIVEIVPRVALFGSAVLAFGAVALLALGVIRLWGSRDDSFTTGVLVPVSTIGLGFGILLLGGVMLAGAVASVAEVHYTPAQPGVVSGPTSTDGPTTEPRYTPGPTPAPSTAFTPNELQSAMQQLVDRTVAAAVPTQGTVTVPVLMGDNCDERGNPGVLVETLLSSPDNGAALVRVRNLWVSEGYALQPTADYAVRVVGAAPLPAEAMVIQDVDGVLRLSMRSVCVVGAP